MVSSADLIQYGLRQQGKPYIFGAEGPNAFDCSGLMQAIFKNFGISIPRVTYDQVKVGSAVAKGSQKPGDLVFSSWDGKPHSHVGMYIGNDQILVAPHSGSVVQTQYLNANYLKHVDAIRRVPGVDGAAGDTGSGSSGIGGIDLPGGVDDAARSIAQSLSTMTGAIGQVGKLAEFLARLSIPSVATRVVSGGIGLALVILGLVILGREAAR